MTWPASASAVLALLRTQLADAGAADGITAGSIHYPSANIEGRLGESDALPLVVIASLTTRRNLLGDQLSVLSGSAQLQLHVAATTTADQAEAIADRILASLGDQVGLVWTALDRGDASQPSAGQLVATGDGFAPAYRTVDLTLAFGIT